MSQHFSKTNSSHLNQLSYTINTPTAGLFYQINLSPAQNLSLSLSGQQQQQQHQQQQSYQTLLGGTKRLLQNNTFQQPNKLQNNFPPKKRSQGSFSNIAFSRAVLRLTQQRKNNDIELSHSSHNNSLTMNSFSPTASYYIPTNQTQKQASPFLSISPENSTYQPSLTNCRYSTPQNRLTTTKHKSNSVLHTRPSTAKSLSDSVSSTSTGWNLKGKKLHDEEDIKDIELIGVRIPTDQSKNDHIDIEYKSRNNGIKNVQKQPQKEKKVINSSRLRKFQEKIKAFKESKDNLIEQLQNQTRLVESKDIQMKVKKGQLGVTLIQSPYVKAQGKGQQISKRQHTVSERNDKKLISNNSYCFNQQIGSSGLNIFTKQNTSQIANNNRSKSLSQTFSQFGQEKQQQQPFQAGFSPQQQQHPCLSMSFPSKTEIKQQNALKLGTPKNQISNKMQKHKKQKVIIFSPSNTQQIRSHIQPNFFIENGLNTGNNFIERNCSTAPNFQLHQIHPQERSTIDSEIQTNNGIDHNNTNKRDSPELGQLVSYYHNKYEEKLPSKTMDCMKKNQMFQDDNQRVQPSISAMGPWIHPSEYLEESLPQSRALKGKQ